MKANVLAHILVTKVVMKTNHNIVNIIITWYPVFHVHSTQQILFMLSVNMVIGERARHYQGCTNLSWCGIYICMYGDMCAIIVVHATHT